MGLITGSPPQDFLVIKVVGLDIHWFSTFLKQTVDIASIYRVVCSALLVPATREVTNGKQFQFSHTFSQDLDWSSLDNNDQVLVDGGMI